MADIIQKRLEDRNKELNDIALALERWHSKLTRAVNAIDKLRARRKKILRPKVGRALSAKKLDDYYKIRETDFGDTLVDL